MSGVIAEIWQMILEVDYEVEEGLCESSPEDTNTTRHGPQISSQSMTECGAIYTTMSLVY